MESIGPEIPDHRACWELPAAVAAAVDPGAATMEPLELTVMEPEEAVVPVAGVPLPKRVQAAVPVAALLVSLFLAQVMWN